MITTEIKVTAGEIRPGDLIKFGPGPLTGVRWEKVLRHSAPPESTNAATDRVGFAIDLPWTTGIARGAYGYYAPAHQVHTIRRNTNPAPSIWTLVAA